jgi:hypothetical protein
MQECADGFRLRQSRHEAPVDASRTPVDHSRVLLSVPVWTAADIRLAPSKRPATSFAPSAGS